MPERGHGEELDSKGAIVKTTAEKGPEELIRSKKT